MLWIHEWVLIQNQGACTDSSEKSSREQSHLSHKKDEDEGSGSSLDGISSDEEGLIGEYQDEEDDGKWSGSDSDEISPDASDPDSD